MKAGDFAKTVLLFQAGEYGHCKVVVKGKGKAINLGNCKGMLIWDLPFMKEGGVEFLNFLKKGGVQIFPIKKEGLVK